MLPKLSGKVLEKFVEELLIAAVELNKPPVVPARAQLHRLWRDIVGLLE